MRVNSPLSLTQALSHTYSLCSLAHTLSLSLSHTYLCQLKSCDSICDLHRLYLNLKFTQKSHARCAWLAPWLETGSSCSDNRTGRGWVEPLGVILIRGSNCGSKHPFVDFATCVASNANNQKYFPALLRRSRLSKYTHSLFDLFTLLFTRLSNMQIANFNWVRQIFPNSGGCVRC